MRSGCRWQDCPAVYGPPTTVYNRFHRWARRGLWQRLLQALVAAAPDDVHLLDSIADAAYDSKALRQLLSTRGTLAVIPNHPSRKQRHPFDPALYRLRNLIERTFCRLKDWRRIATRYDKLARNYAAAVALAIAVTWWL